MYEKKEEKQISSKIWKVLEEEKEFWMEDEEAKMLKIMQTIKLDRNQG